MGTFLFLPGRGWWKLVRARARSHTQSEKSKSNYCSYTPRFGIFMGKYFARLFWWNWELIVSYYYARQCLKICRKKIQSVKFGNSPNSFERHAWKVISKGNYWKTSGSCAWRCHHSRKLSLACNLGTLGRHLGRLVASLHLPVWIHAWSNAKSCKYAWTRAIIQ